jgi:hypothetical protein
VEELLTVSIMSATFPWTESKAKAMLLRDLTQAGGRLFEKDHITPQEAFLFYTTLPEFAGVGFTQFKSRLNYYRVKNGWINWPKTEAREILLEDLLPGGILHGMNHVSEEEAFDFYTTLPEFASVVKSQFVARLKAHREQANAHSEAAHSDMQALTHDRALFPRKTHNARGEVVFDMTAARGLLREDVANKRHTAMIPAEFQKTRPEYMVFKPTIFKCRIYQEERYQKYINWLELKRSEKNQHAPRSHTFPGSR